MKATAFIISLALSSFSIAQNQTYSAAEQSRFHELNLAWGNAKSEASLPYYKAVVDSINQFLAKYPNSAFKSGLLSYKFELTAAVSRDTVLINQLADSLLSYDSLVTTKLGLADILISRNMNATRGAHLIGEALPALTNTYHIYKAYVLLGQYHLSRGLLTAAKSDLEMAIRTDSTRHEAWLAYLTLSRMIQDSSLTGAIQRHIQQLEHRNLLHFSEQSTKSPNLFKSVSPYVLKDIEGISVPLSSLRNNVLIVNFFAFWCGNCVAEFPTLQLLSRKFPSVVFVYVTSDDPAEAKRKSLPKPQFQFLRSERLLFDDSKFSKAMGINAIPRTLIIDKYGVIRFDYLGYAERSHELFSADIRRLLQEN